MLKAFNSFLAKIITPINIFNIIMGLLIGLAHVFLSIPTTAGFILGCVLTLSSTYVIGLNYFFTQTSPPAKEEFLSTTKSKIFLGVSVVMLILNAIAAGFGTFTHLNILLIPALAEKASIVLNENLVFGISLFSACNFGLSCLINPWKHIQFLANKFKTPIKVEVPAPKTTSDNSNTVILDSLKATNIVAIPPKPVSEKKSDKTVTFATEVTTIEFKNHLKRDSHPHHSKRHSA